MHLLYDSIELILYVILSKIIRYFKTIAIMIYFLKINIFEYYDIEVLNKNVIC
jgi:hypothetical protein